MKSSPAVFRIDRFRVPPERRAELVAQLRRTHATLGGLDGCLQNRILEQAPAAGLVNIVTLVEWRDQRAYDEARQSIQAVHRATGFDPQTFLRGAGIEADLGTFSLLPLDPPDA